MTDAIDRCREAIHDADDMLAVATRDDFAALLDLFDAQRRLIEDLHKRIKELENP